MEFFDVLNERFSCRNFLDKEVSDEIINKILDAGIISPTAVNFQPERFYVIKSKDVLEKLKDATKYTFNANVIIAITYDTNVSWHRRSDGKDFGYVDGAICLTNMTNAITALGLGSCIVCSMHEDRVKNILNIPDNENVVALLPLGYMAEKKPHNSRKNKKELVFYR